MNAIEIDQLTKRYGRQIGAEGISLAVAEGSLFGFLGPNGSGKTTTIRVLLGLLRADSGSAKALGFDCWRQAHRLNAEVGYLPGDLRLYSWLTCRLGLRLFGRIRRRDTQTYGLELADDLNLPLDKPVHQMSRGMRQKLGLILAMAHRPRLLILDEPSSTLDPLIQQKLFLHLRRFAEWGHTVFFSSHVLAEVEELCDRVAILRKGRLAEHQSLEILKQRAERMVTLSWAANANSESIEAPANLKLDQRMPGRWRGRLIGSSKDLLRWCADKPVEDIEISPPDLEAMFHQYYDESETPS